MPFRPDTLATVYSRLSSALKEAARTASLAASLGDFLREPVTLARAEDKIKRDLERREEDFLRVARGEIYARPDSPYLKLLGLAGCAFADLEAEVRRHGLEKTLEKLAREGVYLTSDEFRGKKPTVRGRARFQFLPADFLRSDSAPGIAIQTGGTRSAPVRSVLSPARLAEQTHELAVLFAAHGLRDRAHAIYDAALPSSGGIKFLLIYAKMGVRVERWFARKIPANSYAGAWHRYTMTRLIVLLGNLRGHGFPRPDFTDVTEIARIVDWAAEKNRRGAACCIKTGAGNACRIANAARDQGVSLAGVKFLVGGEPFTEAKRDAIERAGARAIPRYSFGEGGSVGLGCAAPAHTDEVHVSEHRLALIQHPRPASPGSAPIHPLLFTTFAPHEVRLLLNVENGDYAAAESRACGCPMERLGLTLHLHHIRSFEKFTSEGMNYFYGDLFELFENILPAEFGGGPGDYQLVEEEDDRGQTRLSLFVHPVVGSLDEAKLLARLRSALAEGQGWNRVTARLWEDHRTVRIVREAPRASARGKILPLHIGR